MDNIYIEYCKNGYVVNCSGVSGKITKTIHPTWDSVLEHLKDKGSENEKHYPVS